MPYSKFMSSCKSAVISYIFNKKERTHNAEWLHLEGKQLCNLVFASLLNRGQLLQETLLSFNSSGPSFRKISSLGEAKAAHRGKNSDKKMQILPYTLTLLHSERPKLYTILALLSAIRLKYCHDAWGSAYTIETMLIQCNHP